MDMGKRLREAMADARRYHRVYILTVVASFGGMLFGWDTGMIGGVLTISSFQRSFALDERSKNFSDLQGNIVSVLQAGCFFGALASLFVSDQLGRRSALLIADAVFLTGSVLQTCSGLHTRSLSLLYVGRVVGGFGVGLISAVVPTYIGENANKEIRGRCIGTMQLFNVTGIMLSYFVNYGIGSRTSLGSLQWRIPFALQMIPGVLLFVGLLFQNESPRWFVEKDRIPEAARALSLVRHTSAHDLSLQKELDEIIQDFRGHSRLSFIQQLQIAFGSKSTFYPLGMAIALMFWQQWTGTNSINYYSPQIFESIGLTSTSAGLFATGIYGVVKVVCTFLALAFATEQLGRKWSLIVGGLGQAFAMYSIGIQAAVVGPNDAGLTPSSYYAIVCVYVFVVFYSGGWGPIPFVLGAECSPTRVRSLVMSAALMTQWLFNFVIAKLTPILLARITYGTYLLFGTCCLLMVVYTVLCVPETKNVPLESVGLLFEGDHIVRAATRDTWPGQARAGKLQVISVAATEDGDAATDDGGPERGAAKPTAVVTEDEENVPAETRQ